MNAIEHARSAVMAAQSGDITTARDQIARAQCHARTAARRERQLVQIAALAVAGQRDRAAGLTLEHAAEFPSDTALLQCINLV
jgi:hypothetical protein